MIISAALIKVILQNTKGKEFEVEGVYWGDGAIRINNPRPEKYPDKFLYTEPNIFYEDDPKRLFWLPDENSEVGELSPFRIKLSLVQIKQPAKKRGGQSKVKDVQ